MLLGEGLHFDAPISASLALLPPEEFEEPRAGRVALGGDAKRNGRVDSPISRIQMYFKRFSTRITPPNFPAWRSRDAEHAARAVFVELMWRLSWGRIPLL